MIEAVKLEADIYPAGPRGLSAYEIYKKEGGQLSEEEWLKSLNGLTPTIGENGNWFLGTVDTGLPSRGPKGDTGSIKFIVVTELPTENIDETAIYMKPVEKPTGKNKFEELIYVNGKWEDLGTPNVAVDLSNYYTKEESDEKLLAKQDKLLAGDNIAISEDNVISSNIGLPVLENQEINIHTFPVGSYIITGKDTVIKYGMNGASSYKPITTNSSTGNTDTWVLNITHDTATENNRGYAFLFRKHGSSGSAALYTFDFSGMNYVNIGQLMERNANQSIYGRFDFYHALPISSLVPSSDRELTNKKYVDDTIKTHYEKMTGYDATKTQVLKNINGTLTWVDEV